MSALHIRGTALPAGERVMLMFPGANTDPTIFPDPEAFDLDRPTGDSDLTPEAAPRAGNHRNFVGETEARQRHGVQSR